MENTYKKITRYSEEHGEKRDFIATGCWSNGSLAYSLVTGEGEDGYETDQESEGCYCQVRDGGHYIMVRI